MLSAVWKKNALYEKKNIWLYSFLFVQLPNVDLRGATASQSGTLTVICSSSHLDLTVGCRNLDLCAMWIIKQFNNGNDVQVIRHPDRFCKLSLPFRGNHTLLCIRPSVSGSLASRPKSHKKALLATVCWAVVLVLGGRKQGYGDGACLAWACAISSPHALVVLLGNKQDASS